MTGASFLPRRVFLRFVNKDPGGIVELPFVLDGNTPSTSEMKLNLKLTQSDLIELRTGEPLERKICGNAVHKPANERAEPSPILKRLG